MKQAKQAPEWHLEPTAARQAVIARAWFQAYRALGLNLLMGSDRHVNPPSLAHFQKLNRLINKSRNPLGVVQKSLYIQNGVGRFAASDAIVFINVSIRAMGRPRLFFVRVTGAGRTPTALDRQVNEPAGGF